MPQDRRHRTGSTKQIAQGRENTGHGAQGWGHRAEGTGNRVGNRTGHKA